MKYALKSSSNIFVKMDIQSYIYIYIYLSKGYEFVGFQIITSDMIHTKVKHIQIMDGSFLQSHIRLQEHTPLTKKKIVICK
jgi:hypothetical protein